MTRVTATPEGLPTNAMQRYYGRFAAGGFGLVITEGSFIDEAFSQTYENQPGMATLAHANAWRPLTAQLQAAGTRVVAQLQHAGALSQFNRHKPGQTIAPSPVQPRGHQMPFYRGEGPYPVPREITDEEIADVVASFGRAAALAVGHAGFDGVEIHGANGYLLDQFLTGHTNVRADRWGSALQQRLEAIVETIKAVRTAVGSGVPVGIRLSQGKVNDFTHKWAEGEEGAEAIFGTLAATGLDYIHLTEFEAWKPAFEVKGPTLVQLARRFAKDTTIIANGGLHDVSRALEVLEHGADIIALGRGALSNPDWPQKVQQGIALEEFDRSILGPIADIKASELAKAA
ncbi:putative oxidoreductase [Comamonas sp. E6]|nr:putative oxidoreductase [Comamonas sp. E6]